MDKQDLQKHIFGIALFLCAVLLFYPGKVSAENVNAIDKKTSDAGASDALRIYYEREPFAEYNLSNLFQSLNSLKVDKRTSGRNTDIHYRETKYGVVCAEGALNIRESTSIFSDIITTVWRKSTVEVSGEKRVNDVTWFEIQFGDIHGYVSAQYVKFDEGEITAYFDALHEKLRDQAVIPTGFTIADDYSHLSQKDQETITRAQKEIQFVLKNDYPKAEKEKSYISMYSILIYLMENYSQVSKIAVNNGMAETRYQCEHDLETIEYLRETIQNTTGQSDEEFRNKIAELQEEREVKAQLSLGEQIAGYAAGFVGKLPYVWGGASLTHGADCSGFASQIFAHFGLVSQGMANMHGYDSSSMRGLGTGISVAQIQAGDLVCYNGHVAIYYGNGCVIHEPSPGRKCEVGSLYMLPIITIRRLH